MKRELKKVIYLEAKVKGYHNHISDIDQTLFDSFWELMETVNYHFDVDDNEYIDIIDMLIMVGHVVVGDYYIIVDNYNADNLEILRETKRQLLEEKESKKMKKHNNDLQGVCYRCGSPDIYYEEAEIVDTYVKYSYECDECNAIGIEWYEMVFIENKPKYND